MLRIAIKVVAKVILWEEGGRRRERKRRREREQGEKEWHGKEDGEGLS